MNEIETLQARLDAVEVRLAHQDRMLEDLNETITLQWKEIDGLNRQIARLDDQLREVQASAGAGEGPEPPPPY